MYKTLINKRKKIFTIIISLILVSILLISGCGKKEKEDVIKIGAILPLTGNLSDLGADEKLAINLALEKFDYKNKIEIIYEDSQGKAKEALNAVSKLSNQGINKIILSTSSVALTTLSKYKSRKYLFIAQCMSPNAVKNYPNAIRIYASVDDETDLMAKFINHYKMEKLGFLYINNEFGKNSTDELIKKIKLQNSILRENFSFADKNYRNQIAKIKQFDADLLTVYSYPQQWPNIIQQLDESKYDKTIMANSGLSFIIYKIKNYNISENIVVPLPKYVYSTNDSKINSFKKLIEKITESSANYDLIYFYDMMKILIDNIYEYPNLSNQELINKITGKDYNGISGRLSFDNRDTKSLDLKLGKISDGDIVILDNISINPAKLENNEK